MIFIDCSPVYQGSSAGVKYTAVKADAQNILVHKLRTPPGAYESFMAVGTGSPDRVPCSPAHRSAGHSQCTVDVKKEKLTHYVSYAEALRHTASEWSARSVFALYRNRTSVMPLA